MKALIKKDKKGFTLVEVIVVLVILAILAAVLVPTLTGYIDRANDRAIIAETRSVVIAAQTLASEAYGLGDKPSEISVGDVADLAEVDEDNITTLTIADDATITKIVYTNGSTCTYENGEYSVS